MASNSFKNMGIPYMAVRKDPVTGKYTSVYVDPKAEARAAPRGAPRPAPPPPPPRAAPSGPPTYRTYSSWSSGRPSAAAPPPRAAAPPRAAPRPARDMEAEHAARMRARFVAEISGAPESAETDIAKRIVLSMTDAQIKERYGATIAEAKRFFKRFILNIAPDKIGAAAGPLYTALLDKLKTVYGGPILGNGRPKKCKICGGMK